MEAQAVVARSKSRFWRFAASTARGVGHYLADNGPQYAAAISYKAIFSIIPLLTFAVTVIGVVLRDDSLRQELIDAIVEDLPLDEEAGVDLERIFTEIPSPWSLLGVVSLLFLLWSASGVMGSLRIALTVASDAPPKGTYAHRKLIDFGVVVALTVLILVAAVLNIVHRTLSQWTDEIFQELDAVRLGGVVQSSVSGFFLPAFLLVAASVFIYWFVPPVRAAWRYLAPGAVLAGISLQAIQLVLAWWLGWSASNDLPSGVIGAVLGFLLTVYISAMAFLVIGELIYAWAGRNTPPRHGQPTMFQRLADRLEQKSRRT